MSSIAIEIIGVVVLILANGLFAMAEIAVLSARKVRLQQRAEEGDRKARAALDLAESPGRFLSTVQIGITLVGVLAGAVGGATLSAPLALWIAHVPALAPYSQGLAVALVVAAITYLSLVVGELVPKRLALGDPERIAANLARPMQSISRLSAPLVSLLTASTEGLVRLLRVRPANEPPVTEDEIKVLMRQGQEVGVFEQAETTLVQGVFRLSDRLVSALLTPRTDIEWVNLEDSFEVNLARVIGSKHGHFPVGEGNLDNVIGILRANDLLPALAQGQIPDLRELATPALFLPESTPALVALERLKSARGHLALVMDEYGGLLGMLTLYDAIEAIVGEIPYSDGEQYSMVTQRDDGSWLVDGMLPVDTFKELFDLDSLPDEDRVGYQTVAGFILAHVGSIPSVGQFFEWGGIRLEVVDMDGLRVDKVLVQKLAN